MDVTAMEIQMCLTHCLLNEDDPRAREEIPGLIAAAKAYFQNAGIRRPEKEAALYYKALYSLVLDWYDGTGRREETQILINSLKNAPAAGEVVTL